MCVDKTKIKRDTSKLWKCTKCKAVFPTIRRLRSHRKEYHRRDSDELRRLKLLTFNESTKKYVCRSCNMEFEFKNEIEGHVRIHDDTFTCYICSENYSSAYKFAVHVQSHGDDKFKCPLCDYETVKKGNVSTHLNRKHYQQFPSNCKYCGKGFTDAVLHREHEKSHEGDELHECVVCNKSFAFSKYLANHQKRNHRVTVGTEEANQCSICKRICSSSDNLTRHMKSHGNFLCDVCGKSFLGLQAITQHRKMHSDVKPFVCSFCSKGFSKKPYLIEHERIHTGEKPFSCKFCEKAFSQRASLKLHVRGHTGDRPYTCHICKTGHISRAVLNIHYRTCSGTIA